MTDLLQAEADLDEAMMALNFTLSASSLPHRVRALVTANEAQRRLLDAQSQRIADLEAKNALLRAATAARPGMG